MAAQGGTCAGGWIIALGGTGVAFVVDAGTVAASPVAIWALRVRSRPDGAQGRWPATSGRAVAYIRSQVWLWGTFTAAAFAYLMFIGPVEVLLPFVVKEEMQRRTRPEW